MMIPLDQIELAGLPVRRIAASADADRALADSIRALGVLQPILVRASGNGFVVIAGARRVRAAREAGLSEIPAEIRPDEGNHHGAAGAAENMVRAAMDPVDQWRAMQSLIDGGYTLEGAAQALGVSEALARRMAKLAHLHPKLLDAMAGQGLPRASDLSVVAAAPLDLQKRAIEAERKGKKPADPIDWHLLRGKCLVARIPKARAIFDVETAKVAFDEDLFAEPGSDDQFTTADVKGFLKAQYAALEQRVAVSVNRGEQIELVAMDAAGIPIAPAGWKQSWDQPTKKRPKKGSSRMVITAMVADGPSCGRVIEYLADRIVTAAAEKKAAAISSLDGGETKDAGEENAARPAISKEGLDLVAAAKTEALHQALHATSLSPAKLLAVCVLAMGANNIHVNGYPLEFETRRYRDLAAKLLAPGGTLASITDIGLVAVAGEALARTIHFCGPRAAGGSYSKHSGDAGEWVGAAVGADHYLPRFDTAPFLAQVGGSVLRELCKQAGIKAKTVADMRRDLVGQLPDWRPAEAQFGAPAPIAPAAPTDQDDTEAA